MRSWEVGRDLCPSRARGQELQGPHPPCLASPSGLQLACLSRKSARRDAVGCSWWAWLTGSHCGPGPPSLTPGQAVQVRRATQEHTRLISRSAPLQLTGSSCLPGRGALLGAQPVPELRFPLRCPRPPRKLGLAWESKQPGGQLPSLPGAVCEGTRAGLVVYTEWT